MSISDFYSIHKRSSDYFQERLFVSVEDEVGGLTLFLTSTFFGTEAVESILIFVHSKGNFLIARLRNSSRLYEDKSGCRLRLRKVLRNSRCNFLHRKANKQGDNEG